MPKLILGSNFVYSHSHVIVSRVDKSVISEPTPAPRDTGVMPMFLESERGIDDAMIEFSGTTALADFINMYGDVGYKRYGYAGWLAKKHLQAGGIVIARRLKREDSQLANAMVRIEADRVLNKTVYVSTVPDTFVEVTRAALNTLRDADGLTVGAWYAVTELDNSIEYAYATAIGVYVDMGGIAALQALPVISDSPIIHEGVTVSVETMIPECRDIYTSVTSETTDPVTTPGMLDLIASVITETDVAEDKLILPIYGITAKGAGKWGNSLQNVFTPTGRYIKDRDGNRHRTFTYELYDYKKGEKYDDYEVSHVVDLRDDIVPMNFYDLLSAYSDKIHVSFYENQYYNFNSLMVDIIEETIDSLDPADAAHNKIKDKLESIVTMMEDDDELQYLDRLELFSSIFESDRAMAAIYGGGEGISNFTLAAGSDGTMNKRFEWDTDTTALYEHAWSGALDDTLMDITKVPANYVLDIGYPTQVKRAIADYTKKRIDIAAVLNIPTAATTKDLAKATAGSFDENENTLIIGSICKHYDPETGKTLDLPISLLLYSTLLRHMSLGYAEPFAGEAAYVSGIEPNSIVPVLHTEQDKSDFADINFNYISQDRFGYYLDGQMTNMLGKYSRLKEFFNIIIHGFIIRYTTEFLNRKRHKLNTPAVIESIRKQLEDDLRNMWGRKVRDIVVVASFRNEQERIRGDVTFDIDTYFHGSIKRYRSIHNVLA